MPEDLKPKRDEWTPKEPQIMPHDAIHVPPGPEKRYGGIISGELVKELPQEDDEDGPGEPDVPKNDEGETIH